MDPRGITIENPYASVTIPRPQLQDSVLSCYLGDDFASDIVLFNPSVLPTYPPAVAQGQEAVAAQNGQKREEAWARPTNPYASLKGPRAGPPEPFRWKGPEAAASEPLCGSASCSCCCCYSSASASSGCQKGCPCCRRCACAVS